MPIRQDAGDIPPKPTYPPDKDPPELRQLWDIIAEAIVRKERKVPDPDKPYWVSMANQRCSRQVYYTMIGAEGDADPPSSTFRMYLGTMVHAVIEDAIHSAGDLRQWMPETRIETDAIGLPGSGRCDLATLDVSDPDNPKVKRVFDFVTEGGFGFKVKTTNFRGGPEGVALGKITQAAVSAVVLGATEGAAVIAVALEPAAASFTRSGDKYDLDRFIVQWSVDQARCVELVANEVARVQPIMAAVKVGKPIRRWIDSEQIPIGAEIVDPLTGRWVVRDEEGRTRQLANTWHCDYCRYKTQCLADGPGTQPQEGM
jgi:hypothetical protein